MPEVVERRLVCDVPACGEPGERVVIDDGRRPMRVILCPEHYAPVAEKARFGVPAQPARARSSRGLSRERLDSLVTDD